MNFTLGIDDGYERRTTLQTNPQQKLPTQTQSLRAMHNSFSDLFDTGKQVKRWGLMRNSGSYPRRLGARFVTLLGWKEKPSVDWVFDAGLRGCEGGLGNELMAVLEGVLVV